MSDISEFTSKLLLPAIISSVLFLFSCKNESKNDAAIIKMLDESLTASNTRLRVFSESISHEIVGKIKVPTTSIRASIWNPKVQQIQKISLELIDYIDQLKVELKKGAGLSKEGRFDENDRSAVADLFFKHAKGNELNRKLKNYKQNILSVDSLIRKTFADRILSSAKSSVINDEEDFTKTFFTGMPVSTALSVLSKFQNDIFLIENQTILFCLNQIPSSCHFYDYYTALISQNSSCVNEGDQIEITAGIGAYSSLSKPEININGKHISIDETGVAITKFKAAGKPGKYSVPVQIVYTDQDGIKQAFHKKVTYIIAPPSDKIVEKK